MRKILSVIILFVFILESAFAVPNSTTHSNATDALTDPSNTFVLTRPNANGVIAIASGGGYFCDNLQVFCVGAGRAYTTIQSALTAIGNAVDAAGVKSPKTVYISGGMYDENLTIPQGRIITLVAEGTVILGNGAGANWSSTVPRSITATFDNADVFGSDIKPALTIIATPSADPTTSFVAESGTFRISGNLNIAGGGLSHTINLANTQIDGTITKTAIGLTNLQGYQLLVVGAVNAGTATILERCYDCQFNSLVTIDGYNALINSEVRAGMTVTTNYNTMPPSGFFFTTFTGTFTGPVNSLKLDLTSDYFFRTNGATLGGGATKVLLASNASSTVTGPLSSTDWTTFNSKEPAITVLPTAKGGTNVSSAGTIGNVLTSDGTNWISAPAGSGSVVFNASDLTLTASDSLAVDPSAEFQRWQVQGGAGAITMSTTPFSGGVVDGTEIVIIGNDDTNTVTFTNNDIAQGCILNGTATLQKYFMITFIYNLALDRYIEKSRSF